MLLRWILIGICIIALGSCNFETYRNTSVDNDNTTDVTVTSPSTSTRSSTSTSTNINYNEWTQIITTTNYVINTGVLVDDGSIYIGDKNSYIIYQTPMKQALLLEFDVRGLQTYDINNEEEAKLVFIQVYDGPIDTVWVGGSSAWANYHLVEVRKKNPQFRIKAGGGCEDCYDIETYLDNQTWNINQLYHMTLKIENGTVTFYQDSEVLYTGTTKYFLPDTGLNVRIGGAPSDLGIPQVYYSNIKIYGLAVAQQNGKVQQ